MKYAAKENGMTEKRENKPMLFAGFALNAAAFVAALVPLLLFLIPGGVSGGSAPLVSSGIYINAVAVAASFVGVVLTAAAKPKSGALARFSLFFGATAFVIALAAFVLCLLFGAAIPLQNIA